MINSDLIQTLVIDRPNLKMNNREKIIGGDSLWRLTEAAKNPIFKTFSPKPITLFPKSVLQFEPRKKCSPVFQPPPPILTNVTYILFFVPVFLHFSTSFLR